MISPLKLLVTAAIVYGVWLLFKYRARIAAIQKEMRAAKARESAARARNTPAQAQDLLPCPKCGAYVATGITCTCEKV